MDLSISKIQLHDRVIFSGVVRDITEQKRDQEAIKQANAELEEFSYRTSHDLRSPLVSSIQLLDLAVQMIDSGDMEQAKFQMLELLKQHPMYASFIFESLSENFAGSSQVREEYLKRFELLKESFLK